MARTPEAALLTERHHRLQLSLSATVVRDLLRVWDVVDPTNLKDTIGPFTEAGVVTVSAGFKASAAAASRYYVDFRRLEGARGQVIVTLPEQPNREEIAGLLRGAGLSGIINARRRGQTPEQSADNGFVKMAGQASRSVLEGGRAVLMGAVLADPEAQGWQRIVAGTCDFCRKQAAMGMHKGARFKAHDHCACTAEPFYEGSRLKPQKPTVGDLQKGDEFSYQGHRFKVLERDPDGVTVQHLKSKATQRTDPLLQVDPIARRQPTTLVGQSAETHLNKLHSNFAQELTDAELRDLDNYVGVSYRTINYGLRHGKALGTVSKNRVRNIDAAIAKSKGLDRDLTLWRGLNSRRAAFGKGDLDSLIGRVVSDKAFASATTRQKIAHSSVGKGGPQAALVKIRARKGQKGAWISGLAKPAGRADVRGLEHQLARKEGEFLLPRNSRFRVVGVKKGLRPEIEVEIV